jgi:hypothetical protein
MSADCDLDSFAGNADEGDRVLRKFRCTTGIRRFSWRLFEIAPSHWQRSQTSHSAVENQAAALMTQPGASGLKGRSTKGDGSQPPQH